MPAPCPVGGANSNIMPTTATLSQHLTPQPIQRKLFKLLQRDFAAWLLPVKAEFHCPMLAGWGDRLPCAWCVHPLKFKCHA